MLRTRCVHCENMGTPEVKGCDLITMATHGRSGFQRWMIGSVTERVLNSTKLPLLITRAQEESTTVKNKQTEEESVKS